MFKNQSNRVATVLSSSLTLRMSRISIVAVTASLVMASSAFASALQDSVPPGKLGKPIAGIVNADGSINTGSGFSVSHDGTGKYTLDVPAGYFKRCPAILATPWGYTSEFPIVDDYDYIICGNLQEVRMQIRVWGRKTGAAQDNSFQFLMIQPQ